MLSVKKKNQYIVFFLTLNTLYCVMADHHMCFYHTL